MTTAVRRVFGSHMQRWQLKGAHVMTGSTSEHVSYYRTPGLYGTRKKGWARNDIIHQVRAAPPGAKTLRCVILM